VTKRTRNAREQARFIHKFDKLGYTHAKLAEEYGVNRSTIRAWLVAAGVDPQLNVKRRRAAREADLVEQLRQVRKLQGRREQAMAEFQAIADRMGVKPLTLAHWHEGTGHYTPGRKVNLRAGRPRSLPRRRSHQGAQLSVEVDRATRPWTARHVAGLLRQRATA
jgi:transcriptional regulator with XRE-family HTH domain